MFNSAMGAATFGVNTLGMASGIAAGLHGLGVPKIPGALSFLGGGGSILGGLGAMAGFGAVAGGLGVMARGGQQMGQVSDMFGNMRFANAQGPYGRGFSVQDMRTMHGAIRAIDSDDPFVSMGDAMRVADKFTKMGMHKGIQDAKKLASKVTELGKSLAEMAKTMGSSMEEASRVFGDMRQAGFYTSADVMGNTLQMNIMRG